MCKGVVKVRRNNVCSTAVYYYQCGRGTVADDWKYEKTICAPEPHAIYLWKEACW